MPSINPFRPNSYLFRDPPRKDPFGLDDDEEDGGDGGEGGQYLFTLPQGQKLGVTYQDPTSGLFYVWRVAGKTSGEDNPPSFAPRPYYTQQFIGAGARPTPILRTIKGVLYEFDPTTKTISPVGGAIETQTANTITYNRVEDADGSLHSVTYRKEPDGSLALDENQEPVVVRKVQTKGPDPAKLVWVDVGGHRVGLHPTTGVEVKRIVRTLTPDQIADNASQAAALQLTREQFEYKKLQDTKAQIDARARESWEAGRQAVADIITQRKTEEAAAKARTEELLTGREAKYVSLIKALEQRMVPTTNPFAASSGLPGGMPFSELPGGRLNLVRALQLAGKTYPGAEAAYVDVPGLGRVSATHPSYPFFASQPGARPFVPPLSEAQTQALTPAPRGFLTEGEAAQQGIWDMSTWGSGNVQRLPSVPGWLGGSREAEMKMREEKRIEREAEESRPFKVKAQKRGPFFQG